mgnify:CR=1 FL=1
MRALGFVMRSKTLVKRAVWLLRLGRLLDTEVKMIMVSAAGIKPLVTGRARKFALHILTYS